MPINPDAKPEPQKRQMSDSESDEMVLAYMQTALAEWDMDMDDLDSVKSVRPAGLMSAAEKKSRGG